VPNAIIPGLHSSDSLSLRKESLVTSLQFIHPRRVDSGDAPCVDLRDATRGYPLDFGDTL
jgi:hypothetical protein